MTRRKPKLETMEVPEEVAEDENVVDTSNDLDVIEEVPETAPEPVEVNNNDVMLPRNLSRYTPPLR